MKDPHEMTYQELRQYVVLHGLKARSRKRRDYERVARRHQAHHRREPRRAKKAGPPTLPLPPLVIGDTPLTMRRALPYRQPLPVSRQ